MADQPGYSWPREWLDEPFGQIFVLQCWLGGMSWKLLAQAFRHKTSGPISKALRLALWDFYDGRLSRDNADLIRHATHRLMFQELLKARKNTSGLVPEPEWWDWCEFDLVRRLPRR